MDLHPTPDPGLSLAPRRYSAFISYNQADRDQARWLHRALETYRFPKNLLGRSTKLGTLGKRLQPVFQDREELSSSTNLAESVRQALAQSASLVVVCSPNGAKSKWVNEEIREFIRLGRRANIQCLVIAGEPVVHSLDQPGDAQCCFPPALFEDGGREPLAADIRPGMDGKRLARLKLIAGITGLALDELRQRENARRTRNLIIATTVLGLALVVVASLAVVALLSRNEAIAQRDIARRKTITAERTVEFVKSMFAVADPSQARGATITARQIVDLGAQRIDLELEGEPSVKADLQITLGEVYTNLGLFNEGNALLRRSLDHGPSDPELKIRQRVALAEALSWQADDDGAAAAFGEALKLADVPGFERPDLTARILVGLGETEGYRGDPKRGEGLIRRALALDRARGEKNEAGLARSHEALGQVYLGANRLSEARIEYQEALRLRMKRQGELHPRTIQDLNQLGAIAYLANDSVAAERYWVRQLPLAEKVLGPDHPEVAVTLNNIARIRVEQARYQAAIPLLRRALSIQATQRTEANQELVFPLYNLALALRSTGEPGEARRLLERDLVIAKAHKHRNLPPILVELADLACHEGNSGRAINLLSQAKPAMKEYYPDQPWRMALLEYVESSCRKDSRKMKSTREAVLARWPVPSHFGNQVSDY